MMTKERGSEGKREGQRRRRRRSGGEKETEGEPVLFGTLPVEVATSQRQYNHRMCLKFGIICGRKKRRAFGRTRRHDDIFICCAGLLSAIIFLG